MADEEYNIPVKPIVCTIRRSDIGPARADLFVSEDPLCTIWCSTLDYALDDEDFSKTLEFCKVNDGKLSIEQCYYRLYLVFKRESSCGLEKLGLNGVLLLDEHVDIEESFKPYFCELRTIDTSRKTLYKINTVKGIEYLSQKDALKTIFSDQTYKSVEEVGLDIVKFSSGISNIGLLSNSCPSFIVNETASSEDNVGIYVYLKDSTDGLPVLQGLMILLNTNDGVGVAQEIKDWYKGGHNK